jgi:hypothetical protein
MTGKPALALPGRMDYFSNMELDDIQLAAQEQFARRSERYGKGHILENVEDVQAALQKISLPGCRTK